jgi:hypothetical protein
VRLGWNRLGEVRLGRVLLGLSRQGCYFHQCQSCWEQEPEPQLRLWLMLPTYFFYCLIMYSIYSTIGAFLHNPPADFLNNVQSTFNSNSRDGPF